MRRARVDLPQPDSPTIPRISPRCTSKDTPSTAFTYAWTVCSKPPWMGKYLRRFCTLRRLLDCSMSCTTLEPDIHGIPQAIAQQIERHRGKEDHHAGQYRDPGIHINGLPQRVQHQAPLRIGWGSAQAQEAEARGQDDTDTDQGAGIDEDRREHVGNHVMANDGDCASPAGPGGFHELPAPHLGGDAFGNAGD